MFNFKFKMSRDIIKNKNECQLTSTFSSKMSPQYHMPSSRVISISNPLANPLSCSRVSGLNEVMSIAVTNCVNCGHANV